MQRGRAEGEEGSSQSPANRSHRLPSETVTGITLTATPAPPKGEGRHQSDPRLFSASKGRSPLATPRRSERRAHRSAVLRPSYPVKKPVKKPIVCKKIGHLIGFLSLDPEGPGLGERPPARLSFDRGPTTSPIRRSSLEEVCRHIQREAPPGQTNRNRSFRRGRRKNFPPALAQQLL